MGGWRVVLAALALALPTPAGAQAQPWGTVRVQPSTSACGGHDLASRAACGAAFTAQFLRSRGAADVVRETLIVAPGGVGVWRSSTTGGLRRFGRVGGVGIGLHHCDRRTFVDPGKDAKIFTGDVAAITALVHESAHGIQERSGYDPVAVTLSGDRRRLYPLEQSADCWAGVGIAWFIAMGKLPRGADRPARDLLRGVNSSAGHGSGAERAAAFDAGYTRGAAACDAILGARVFPRG